MTGKSKPSVPQDTTRSRHHRQQRITAWHAPGTQPEALEKASERGLRLSRLVPLWPAEIDAPGEAAAQRVVDMLERALRGERRRGRGGQWSYDINRHLALARTLREERVRLARLRREQSGTRNSQFRLRGRTSEPSRC